MLKMSRRMLTDGDAPFKTINEASRLTGLSRDYIRKGVRAGTIPAIKIGEGSGVYMIDVELFLEQLHRSAERGVNQ